jgi:hypothetical protein
MLARVELWRYAPVLSPAVMDFISLEADARAIRTYQMVLIPGLLQTKTYVSAALSESDSRGFIGQILSGR